MNRQICECGDCPGCRQRGYWRKWNAAHPEYRQSHPDKRTRKGPYVHPTTARMDRMAEAVWARHALPGYYDTGLRVLAEHRAVAL
jgi:hypothetical protein